MKTTQVEIKRQVPWDGAFPFLFRKVKWNYWWNKIFNEIKYLDEWKATQYHDSPTKVIKENRDIFANFLTENFNDMFENSVFPDSKQANINPVYKKISGRNREITGL